MVGKVNHCVLGGEVQRHRLDLRTEKCSAVILPMNSESSVGNSLVNLRVIPAVSLYSNLAKP